MLSLLPGGRILVAVESVDGSKGIVSARGRISAACLINLLPFHRQRRRPSPPRYLGQPSCPDRLTPGRSGCRTLLLVPHTFTRVARDSPITTAGGGLIGGKAPAVLFLDRVTRADYFFLFDAFRFWAAPLASNSPRCRGTPPRPCHKPRRWLATLGKRPRTGISHSTFFSSAQILP